MIKAVITIIAMMFTGLVSALLILTGWFYISIKIMSLI